MNKFCLGVFITSLFLLTACKKGNEPATPVQDARQPDIEVLEPMLLQEGGVRLSIKVNSVPTDPIYAYSVIVSKDSLFREAGISRNFELPMRVKTYHYDLLSGLEQDAVYYYTYRINYWQGPSEQKRSFTFGKESRVVIDSISPQNAGVGDTLKVYGKFKDYTFTKATLGDSIMNFIRKAENLVEIPLEHTTPIGNNSVSLFTKYQRILAESSFSLVTPRIISIPEETSTGEEITILGENFSQIAGQNKVFLNDVQASVNSFSRSQLKVTVPNSITSASLRVAVHAQKQIALSDKVLKIRIPKIIAVPGTIRINQNYNLQFEDLPNVNVEVFLDDRPLVMDYRRYDQGGYNYLSIRAPIAIYPNKKPKLSLKYLDQTILLKQAVEIVDRWELIATSVPFEETRVRGTLNINGSIYVVSTPKSDFSQTQYYLWKFNSTDNTFSRIEIPYATDFPTVSCDEENIYLYAGKLGDNFYQYNTTTRSWKKLENYPSQPRHSGVMSSVNGNVYITTGQNPVEFWNTVEDNSLYRYNIQNNQWKRMEESYPILNTLVYDNRINGTSMVIGDEFYVIGGGRTTGTFEVFAFNTLTDKWSRKADYDPVMYASAVVKNGHAVVLSNNTTLKRYDSIHDSWSTLSEYLLPYVYSNHFYQQAFFITGSNVYVVYGGMFLKMKLTDVLP